MPDMEITECIVKMRYGMEIGYGQEIIRCEKCIYGDDFDCPAPLPKGYLCQKGHGPHTGDWFCADGKRR